MTDYLTDTPQGDTGIVEGVVNNEAVTGTKPAGEHIVSQLAVAAQEAEPEPKYLEYHGERYRVADILNEAGLGLAAGMAEAGKPQGLYRLVEMLVHPAESDRFINALLDARLTNKELEALIQQAVEVIGQRPLDK